MKYFIFSKIIVPLLTKITNRLGHVRNKLAVQYPDKDKQARAKKMLLNLIEFDND